MASLLLEVAVPPQVEVGQDAAQPGHRPHGDLRQDLGNQQGGDQRHLGDVIALGGQPCGQRAASRESHDRDLLTEPARDVDRAVGEGRQVGRVEVGQGPRHPVGHSVLGDPGEDHVVPRIEVRLGHHRELLRAVGVAVEQDHGTFRALAVIEHLRPAQGVDLGSIGRLERGCQTHGARVVAGRCGPGLQVSIEQGGEPEDQRGRQQQAEHCAHDGSQSPNGPATGATLRTRHGG